MTRLIDQLAKRPSAQRVLIALVLAGLSLFLLGVGVGVAAAILEKGWPSHPVVALIPVVALPLGIIGGWIAWRLVAPPTTASPYERRYWNIWLGIAALGIPAGLIGGAILARDNARFSDLFSSAPVSQGPAIFLAVLITIVGFGAITLYHRAVDDHEERAYLWGSQFAYYFLLVAFPAWWLLERGGVVAPLGTGVAFVAILISVLIQAAVWAWLKFR